MSYRVKLHASKISLNSLTENILVVSIYLTKSNGLSNVSLVPLHHKKFSRDIIKSIKNE